MRLVLCFSLPVYETDFNRYLLDGYLFSRGVNPYAHAPVEWLPVTEDSIHADIRRIRQDIQNENPHMESILQDVNHPEIKTIYPPFTQCLFALAAWFAPGSLPAWRLVVLAFDAVLIVAIVVLLLRVRMPVGQVVIYAWSPLVLKESINTTHVDGIMLATLFLSLIVVTECKRVPAGLLMGMSILTKWATAMLLPVFASALGWKGMLACLGFIVAFVLLVGGLGQAGGLAFSHSWESNSSIVLILEKLYAWIGVPAWGEGAVMFTLAEQDWTLDAFLLARCSGVLIVLAVTVFLYSRIKPGQADTLDVIRRSMVILGAILLCSPVSNPWYVMWIVPFLCFVPHASWMLLSMTCMAYYLYFIPEPRAYVPGVWEAQYIPFFLLLLYEIRYGSLLNQPGQEREAR